jgi:hypothetical protein
MVSVLVSRSDWNYWCKCCVAPANKICQRSPICIGLKICKLQRWTIPCLHASREVMNDKSKIITDQMGGIINAICAVQVQMNKTINDESVEESCWWHQHGKDYFYNTICLHCIQIQRKN